MAGLVAVADCGRKGPFQSPQALVWLSPAGQPTASWRLPGCSDGIAAFADPTFWHVLVQADVGYGSTPPCGSPQDPGVTSIRLLAAHAGALDTIAAFPGSTQIEATGW